ncbi:MAG: hypothetical protein H8D62_00140 [Bacteroidetes bacterium]|nr:hypothetical protein [Bacteroidota bacterium]
MYTGLSHLHHYLPYVLLFLMALVIVKSAMGMAQGSEHSAGDKKLGLFAMIAAHLQFTVGLVLYFISPMVMGMGEAMSNGTSRLYALEHPLMMLIAVVLLTMARSKTKTITAVSAHKTTLVFFTISMIAILSRIPWEQWLA